MLAFAVRHDPVAALIEDALSRLERASDPKQPDQLPPSNNSVMEAYDRTTDNIQSRLAKLRNRSLSLESPSLIPVLQSCPKCGQYPHPGELPTYNNGIPIWHQNCRRPTAR
jgi:hypothetical protein